jgi:opacity protein-like surface antigen
LRALHVASFAAALLLSVTAAAACFAQSGDASTPVPGQAAAPPPHAGVCGLDVMTSTVFLEHQSSFAGTALRLRLRSARLVPNIEFIPLVEYWRSRSSVSAYGGVQLTRSDATLGCSARWVFIKDHWQPYLGAGVAAHFLDDKLNAPGLGVDDQHDSSVRGAYLLLGGVTFPITKSISNFLELEYHGVSDFRQFKLHTGLGWSF